MLKDVEVALQMHNKLLELLDIGGFHRETESFSTDPRSALQHIKVNWSIRTRCTRYYTRDRFSDRFNRRVCLV